MRERGAIPTVLLEVTMSTQSTISAGKKVYEIIRPSISVKFPDQYAVIDPISKEYFIDAALGKALAKAHARFPGRDFYSVQIGKDTAMKMKV